MGERRKKSFSCLFFSSPRCVLPAVTVETANPWDGWDGGEHESRSGSVNRPVRAFGRRGLTLRAWKTNARTPAYGGGALSSGAGRPHACEGGRRPALYGSLIWWV